MRFSVVIPLFNKAPHVRAAVDSALDQTLAPHEIIIIDDGSTDDGLAIVRSIDDARIKVLTRSPPGPGGYAARNLGVEHAGGEWIAFLDADDRWHPQHLADLAAARAAAGGEVGCLFSRFEIKQEGRDRPYPIDQGFVRPDGPVTLAAFISGWLSTERCPMWTGAVAIRRDVIDQAGGFPAGRARRGGDKDLWLRCMAITHAGFAPSPSAEFHQDTVNRVTTGTGHVDLPIVVETIRQLEGQAAGKERSLLRALRNQEVRLYARHAAGAGSSIGLPFFAALNYPQGLTDALRICAYQAVRWTNRLRLHS